jgi:hypothetical protein
MPRIDWKAMNNFMAQAFGDFTCHSFVMFISSVAALW